MEGASDAAKPIISIWATEEGWHCSGCDYCGSTEKAARNHVSYKHGGCRVKKRDKADALAAEDLEVHYRDVGGAYKCEGCGTVMEACERAMRYHIQKQHHATAVKAKLLVLPKVADQQTMRPFLNGPASLEEPSTLSQYHFSGLDRVLTISGSASAAPLAGVSAKIQSMQQTVQSRGQVAKRVARPDAIRDINLVKRIGTHQHFKNYFLRTSHGPLPIGLAVLGTVHEVGTLYVMYPTLNPDVRGIVLSGADARDSVIKGSFESVVTFMELHHGLLEQWLGQKVMLPRADGPGVKLTFEAATMTSYVAGNSGGAVIFLSLLSFLSKARIRDRVGCTGTFSASGLVGIVGSLKAKVDMAKVWGLQRCVIPAGMAMTLSGHPKEDGMVIEAKDVVDLLHLCLEGVDLPPVDVMRAQLEAAQQSMAVVRLGFWSDEVKDWAMLPVEATATVRPGAGPGGVKITGIKQGTEGTYERYVDNVITWVARYQDLLQYLHGPFSIDFKRRCHVPTGRPVDLHVVVPCFGQLAPLMVPVVVALVSLTTGRRIDRTKATVMATFLAEFPPDRCAVAPLCLGDSTVITAARKINTLADTWGLRAVVMSSSQCEEIWTLEAQALRLQLEMVTSVQDAVEALLEPRAKTVTGGLLKQGGAASSIDLVVDTLVRPFATLVR